MREPTIARNYAEVLLTLARRANDLDGWGKMIGDVADAVERDGTLRVFLETPRVAAAEKNRILGQAFQDRMPRLFVRFLQSLVSHHRQMLIGEIAREYGDLVDAEVGRVHARVTVARDTDAAEREAIAKGLTRAIGKQVVPHISVNPSILGGVVVRMGDMVMDGSVRRRLASLRTRMLYGASR